MDKSTDRKTPIFQLSIPSFSFLLLDLFNLPNYELITLISVGDGYM